MSEFTLSLKSHITLNICYGHRIAKTIGFQETELKAIGSGMKSSGVASAITDQVELGRTLRV